MFGRGLVKKRDLDSLLRRYLRRHPPENQQKPHRRHAHSSTPSSSTSRTHSRLVKAGSSTDIYSWNSLLTTYGKSHRLEDAHKLFDEIPHPDLVSWNALIAAHVSHWKNERVWEILVAMMRRKIGFDTYTLGSVLKSVACVGRVEAGRQLHCLVEKRGFGGDVYSGSALVDMYAKCGRMVDAASVFALLPVRNVVSWNAVIGGYARAGDRRSAVRVFESMVEEEESVVVVPDEATFASVLSLMNGVEFLKGMLQLHCRITKCGWAMDTVVCNAAINAYSQCGSIDDAEKVFQETGGIRDLVTWNSMLAAYTTCEGFAHRALCLFRRMMEVGMGLDVYTFTSAVSACFEKAQFVFGRMLHGLAMKMGYVDAVPVSNSLIKMYMKSGDGCTTMKDAVKCFDSMEFRDNVSWNSVLTGLSQSGLSEDAMKFFCRMRSYHLKCDHFAFSAALRSCSDLAVLELGMQVHGSLVKSGFGLNEFVVSSLIYMYSKCGVIHEAKHAFDQSRKESAITWNSIIFAYAQHGQGQTALDMFHKMQELQVKPDHITFVGILSACSHIGLVEEGMKIFDSIETVHNIPLRMEHYACGVDVYGRAGKLDSAKKLIDSMPFKPDSMVWMTLLGACRTHGDIELANKAARHLLDLEPGEHSTYVLLSHMYSRLKIWDGKAVIQRVMKERGVSKVPGWSWVEVNNEVHSFNAEDRSHFQAEIIYKWITKLMEEVRRVRNDVDCEFTLHDQYAI